MRNIRYLDEPLPSSENVREKRTSNVIRFELNEIKTHFEEGINEVEKQFDIIADLNSDVANDKVQNILRAQVVLLESVFDFYMHELVKFGLIHIFEGDWEKTSEYNKLKISMDVVEKLIDKSDNSSVLLEYINDDYSTRTLVGAKNFKKALELVGIDYEAVARIAFYKEDENVQPVEVLKAFINQLYERRNIIAHQFDREHTNAERKIIDIDLVQYFIHNLMVLIEAIHIEAQNNKK